MKAIYLLLTVLMTTSTAVAQGKFVSYQVDGVRYEGYFISPHKKAPLILLVHDWDGLTDYEVQRSEMLAAAGYAVFAVDLFGAGVRPTKVEDRRQHTGALYKDREKMRRLLFSGLKTARDQGADTSNAVAVGYCFGGAAVLELARAGADLKGVVSFHGGLGIPEGQDYAKIKTKILVFHGTADAAIPMEEFALLAQQLEAHQISHEMITYGGAPHAFTVFGDERYREDADRKSWMRFLAFLGETLADSKP